MIPQERTRRRSERKASKSASVNSAAASASLFEDVPKHVRIRDGSLSELSQVNRPLQSTEVLPKSWTRTRQIVVDDDGEEMQVRWFVYANDETKAAFETSQAQLKAAKAVREQAAAGAQAAQGGHAGTAPAPGAE